MKLFMEPNKQQGILLGAVAQDRKHPFSSYIFLIFFLQRWLKTGEEPMRLSVEWEP